MCSYNLGFENSDSFYLLQMVFCISVKYFTFLECWISTEKTSDEPKLKYILQDTRPVLLITMRPSNTGKHLRQLLETGWGLEDTATCNGMLWLGPWNRERMSGKKPHWNLMGFFQWTWLRVRPILVYKQQTYHRKTKMQWWEKETRTETREPSAPSLHSLKLLKVFKFNFVTMGSDSIQTDHILLPY